MTTPVAVIGLTYNGTDVQDADLGIFLEIVRGLSEGVRVRGKDTIVPALAGRIARNRVADGFIIELRGFVRGSGADEDVQRGDFRANVDTLRGLFDPTALPATLVATLEDGTTRECEARTLPENPLYGRQPVPSFQEVSIELESLDADWSAGGS